MKIALVTDAWFPQVNGVVTTLNQTATQLRHMGHEVRMVTSTQQKHRTTQRIESGRNASSH